MESIHNIPLFLTKLYQIVQGNLENEILQFDQTGKILILRDQERLATYLLPEYFGHKNLPSFLRQLNMYGFKKRQNGDIMEFKHKYFRRDGKQMLQQIKRRNELELMEQIPNQEEITQSLDQLKTTQSQLQNLLQSVAGQNFIIMNTLIQQQQQMAEASKLNFIKFSQLGEQIRLIAQQYQPSILQDIENNLAHQKREAIKGLEYVIEDTQK